MKLGVLFSGGKDSCFALYRSMQHEEVTCLITLISKNPESYMFHTPNIELSKLQSEALEIPQVTQKTRGEKEKELEDLKKAIKIAIDKYKIDGIVSGAIDSVYQASRIQRICNELNIWCFNPLWQMDQIELMKDMIKEGFVIKIIGVYAYPLTTELLGKNIDVDIIKDFAMFKEKYGINPAGEGGEVETLVVDGPIFKKRIEILDSRIEWNENSGTLKIKDARLVEK